MKICEKINYFLGKQKVEFPRTRGNTSQYTTGRGGAIKKSIQVKHFIQY